MIVKKAFDFIYLFKCLNGKESCDNKTRELYILRICHFILYIWYYIIILFSEKQYFSLFYIQNTLEIICSNCSVITINEDYSITYIISICNYVLKIWSYPFDSKSCHGDVCDLISYKGSKYVCELYDIPRENFPWGNLLEMPFCGLVASFRYHGNL